MYVCTCVHVCVYVYVRSIDQYMFIWVLMDYICAGEEGKEFKFTTHQPDSPWCRQNESDHQQVHLNGHWVKIRDSITKLFFPVHFSESYSI